MSAPERIWAGLLGRGQIWARHDPLYTNFREYIRLDTHRAELSQVHDLYASLAPGLQAVTTHLRAALHKEEDAEKAQGDEAALDLFREAMSNVRLALAAAERAAVALRGEGR